MSDVCEEYNDSSFDQCITGWIENEIMNLFNCSIVDCQLETRSTSGQEHILDYMTGDIFVTLKAALSDYS
jgi:hypothetical protein